jgi:hypothetical protein
VEQKQELLGTQIWTVSESMSAGDDVRSLYRNFDQFHPWVKKLLVTVTYGSGGAKGEMNSAWMDHTIAVKLNAMPTVKDRLVGSLSREEVKEWDQCFERINLDAYLDSDQYNDAQKTNLRQDLWARKWAVTMLQRLEDDEADEQWRKDHPEPPLEGDPASGENDEAGRGASLPPPGVQELTGLKEQLLGGRPPVEEEGRGEVPTAPRETLEDSEQTSQELEPVNEGGLLDPNFIKTAEHFLASVDAARLRLRESDNVSDAQHVSSYGDVLEAVARALQLGPELEYEGKALRFSALQRFGELIEPKKTGRGHKSEVSLSKREQNLVSLFRKLSKEEFETRLERAKKNQDLSEATFAIKSGSGNKTSRIGRLPKTTATTSSANGTQTGVTQKDDAAALRRMVADFLGNELWYLNLGVDTLAADPQIRDNLPGMKDKLKLCLDRVCERIQGLSYV